MRITWRMPAARWVEGLAVLLLGCSALYEIWIQPGAAWPGSPVISSVLAATTILPVLFRRRFPLAVLILIIAASAVQYAYGGNAFQPFFAFLLAYYAVAAHSEARHAIVGGVVGVAAVVAADSGKLLAGESVGDVVPGWFFLAGVWVFGRWIRGRRLHTRQLEDRAAQLELEREERARAAVAAERARIARELHDVVAHSVSVMVVQAQAAQRLAGPDQADLREMLGTIEITGRQALVEMRRLLGVLRRSDANLALSPQPGLSDLDALVQHMRAAGVPVELRIEGEREPLPPGVDLSAYRIVQEALTNTLKHAGPAHACVTIRYRTNAVELEINDDGAGTGMGGGAGQGLIGMRERAAIYGGVFESGRQNGGYVVRARLPLGVHPE